MLIKNGLIVSPGNQLEQPADLRIRNGIIETIAAANRTIDVIAMALERALPVLRFWKKLRFSS